VADETLKQVFLTLLSATLPGEAMAARDALVRLARSRDIDIHVLADRINANGKLSNAEMRKLYDAGYRAGIRATELKQFSGGEDFMNVDGTPAWDAIARFCQQQSPKLRNDKERQFVADMAARTVYREPTAAQEKWLRSIFYRMGGKL
jgi:hypothetical protein